MSEIFVLVEHRNEQLREITFEMLTKAKELAANNDDMNLTALLFADKAEKFIDKLKGCADKIVCIEDDLLAHFNSEIYQQLLVSLIKKRKPILTLIGHTATGIDIAPSLAVELDVPLITDCISLNLEKGKVSAEREMYGGKVNSLVNPISSESTIATIRQAVFPQETGQLKGEIEKIGETIDRSDAVIKFLEYIEAEKGDVDITQADIIISAGRGIKEKDNLVLIENFAKAIGGVVACSRPIVDAGWLTKDRQVGSSGKTVNPKLYIAVGISGSSQHLTGMKGAATIIAINKDPNAPIFNVADYGIVDDLFKIVPTISNAVKELRPG